MSDRVVGCIIFFLIPLFIVYFVRLEVEEEEKDEVEEEEGDEMDWSTLD